MIFRLWTARKLEKDGLSVAKTSNFLKVRSRDKTRKDRHIISFHFNLNVRINMTYSCLPSKRLIHPCNVKSTSKMLLLKRSRI